MEAQDALSQLADIHLPGDVSWWPPAPGWWLLGVFLLAVVVMALVLGWRYYHRRQALANALQTLDEAQQRYHQKSVVHRADDQAALEFITDINQTLRRVALLYFPPDTIAPLSGRSWLDFLDQSDARLNFHDDTVVCLGEMAYRRHFTGDPEPAYQLARQWIRHRYLSNSLWRPVPGGKKQSPSPRGNAA